MEYDTFPVKKFYRIVENLELLEKYGIPKKEWEELLDEWDEKHPSPDTARTIEAHRKIILETIKINKQCLLLFAAMISDDDARDFFDSANIKFIEDDLKRAEYLNTQINKSKQKIIIYEAQRQKLEKEIEESKKNDSQTRTTLREINRSLVTLNMVGFTIIDLESVTLGQYDAMNEVTQEKSRKHA